MQRRDRGDETLQEIAWSCNVSHGTIPWVTAGRALYNKLQKKGDCGALLLRYPAI